ncbi:MAG: PCMD domain-containing protein [Muribaculaceae bacterium]|nr:PCMD domain-containing protein [Muribaculaceae bacterium]
MKMIKNIFAISAVVVLAGMSLQSCQSEAPFSTEGEALVRLNVDVNSKLTRAVDGEEELKAGARIYISNDKGVLNKWTGVQNIPQDGFYLRYGAYTAEVMAGDSVPASFTKRYFKGATEFSVGSDAPTTQVSVSCRIANVVVSIEESTIDANYVSDLSVEVGNSRGYYLTYAADSIMKDGYFMMPSGETALNYIVSGKNSKGEDFTKSGVIEDVKSAHNYRLHFDYDMSGEDKGGAFLIIAIEEENLIEEEVTIYGRPAFSWVGNDPAADSQIIGTPGSFGSKILRVAAYGGFRELTMTSADADLTSALGGDEFELTDLTETGRNHLLAKGIAVTTVDPKDNLYRYYVEFSASFLNSLPARDTEFVLTMTAVDVNGKHTAYNVRIANTEEAIVYADPIIIDFEGLKSDLTAVSARSASIPVSITDETAVNPSVQYRKTGETAWNTVPVSATRATGTINVRISGLSPNSEYEVRVVAGEVTDGSYEFESAVSTFSTESEFVIPNASMEEWSTYSAQTMLGKKNVVLPDASGDKLTSFWGSGNEGSATANMTLTDKNTDMFHSGAAAARLASSSAFNVLAAGNLFVGNYKETYETSNGKLSFGREYDGSHPSKMRVWVNYRPGVVNVIKSGMDNYVPAGFSGGSDHGQIYVALTTGEIEVRTGSDRKLFSPEPDGNSDARVVGYGQVTWDSDYGADGSLEMLEIPIEYTSIAKTVKPTHLIIVCSASKYGDYFCGSSKSVMYVDDFELVYE